MTNQIKKCEGLNDDAVIRKSLTDISYFACIYERYEIRLIHYIIKISGCSQHEAEDILQDSFIKIWKNLNAFDHSFPFSSWLYRIVHNATVSYWRKGKTRSDINLDMQDAGEQSSQLFETNDLDREQSEEKSRQVHQILQQLKKEYREVLILKYFENMSYEEISDILRIPEGTVATRLNRAKRSFSKISGGKLDSL